MNLQYNEVMNEWIVFWKVEKFLLKYALESVLDPFFLLLINDLLPHVPVGPFHMLITLL